MPDQCIGCATVQIGAGGSDMLAGGLAGHGITEAYGRSKGRSYDDAEPELKRDRERIQGNVVERAVPGDSDRDGK